ncbi:IS91 family transposase, partial [Desulfoferrobacter suflitae]|uniref:IS91 family transposase n=1 Tax=Desulfoferrobacter suflitae TaxID=2865782 RepID=UPI002164C411
AGQALPQVQFPRSVWEKDWVVYSKPGMQGAERVLQYLARYVHRVAITNSRILSIEGGQIRFRYKDSREKAWKMMSLPAEEFIRRFLQHVLPRGFHKVRYYGFLAPSNRRRLQKAQQLLADCRIEPGVPTVLEPTTSHPPQEARLCPSCKTGRLRFLRKVPRKERAPP